MCKLTVELGLVFCITTYFSFWGGGLNDIHMPLFLNVTNINRL